MSGRIGPPKTIPPPPPIPSVVIGTQTWMLYNLDVTTYRDGTDIPRVTNQSAWAALTTGAWCYYNNDPLTEAVYGKLYNWYAVNDAKGLAPVGYHVPSIAEYITLRDYLGGSSVAGGPLKETGTTHWNSPNTGATNSSGWTGLPGGLRAAFDFSYLNEYGYWWSSTAGSSTAAQMFYLSSINTILALLTYNRYHGASVRLIKD